MSESPEGLPRFPKRSGRRKSAAQAGESLLNAGGGMRVATYTRISTDEVNKPYSLEAQADHLNKYLSMRPEWTLVGQYSDQMTGLVMERPGLKKLLADVRACKLDVILVYRVDRFSRKLHHIQDLLQVLEQEKVAFVSATEAFDTSNSMGRMVLNILGVFAEFERSSLIDRIRAGNAAKASRGEWVGGKPPYGYQVAEGKTLRIIESEAAVVRDIFRGSRRQHGRPQHRDGPDPGRHPQPRQRIDLEEGHRHPAPTDVCRLDRPPRRDLRRPAPRHHRTGHVREGAGAA